MLELIGQQPAWVRGDGPDADVALTTRVRLARNLDGFCFPNRAKSEELKRIAQTITDSVRRVDRDKSLVICDLKEASRLERRVLAERHRASGDHLADTRNRALVLSKTGAISLMVNEEDHLRMQCILSGLCPEDAWSVVDRLETLLSEKLSLAYSDRFGYLTSHLSNAGTGLRVSVMVHLPALAIEQRLTDVLRAAATLGTTVRGLFGEGSASAGNLYQISNSLTLGMAEEEIIHRVTATANHLIREEREERDRLYRRHRVDLEDRVFRALGVLGHCRKISTVEATGLLSDLRLGIDLGILEQPKPEAINELLLAIRPGWLQLLAGHSLDPDRRDIRRAELLRERMAGLQ